MDNKKVNECIKKSSECVIRDSHKRAGSRNYLTNFSLIVVNKILIIAAFDFEAFSITSIYPHCKMIQSEVKSEVHTASFKYICLDLMIRRSHLYYTIKL